MQSERQDPRTKTSFSINWLLLPHITSPKASPTQGTNFHPAETAYDAPPIAKAVVVVNDTPQTQPNPSETTWHVQHREPVALIE